MPTPSPLDIETLWKLERVASVALAPDGIRRGVRGHDVLDEGEQGCHEPVAAAHATPARRVASPAAARKTASPRGPLRVIASRSSRKREQEGAKDAESQLYVIDAAGGEAERVTRFLPGIEDFKWMPDGGASPSSRGCGRARRGPVRRTGRRRLSTSARKAPTSPPRRSTGTSTAACPWGACRTCCCWNLRAGASRISSRARSTSCPASSRAPSTSTSPPTAGASPSSTIPRPASAR